MEKKQKKLSWKKVLFLLSFLIAGGGLGFGMARQADVIAEAGVGFGFLGNTVLFLVWMYVTFFLHILIHEAGHLVGGLLTGYEFSSYRIGSFMWLKQEDKLVLRRLSIAGTGGQCLMNPPDMVDGKIPYVLYNMGGALANVLFSVLVSLLIFLFGLDSIGGTMCLIFALIGLAIAAMNGIPMSAGGVDNDGMNAVSLGKHPKALRAFWIQIKGNEMISRGARPKDMPAEWFEIPTEEELKNPLIAAIAVLACSRLEDEGKWDEADALMEQLLAEDTGLVQLHRYLLTGERLFLELVRENRPEVVEKYYTKEQKKFMKTMKNYPSVLRIKYAYAMLAENDPEKAAKELEAFEKTAKTYPYPSEIEGEREMLALVKPAYEAQFQMKKEEPEEEI